MLMALGAGNSTGPLAKNPGTGVVPVILGRWGE